MVCQGHKTKWKFIQAKFPTRSFYLFKRDKFKEWFNCLSRENKAILYALIVMNLIAILVIILCLLKKNQI